MTVGATCGMYGADAVEFKVVVWQLAIRFNKEFNARVLMYGRVVFVVDCAQIVTSNKKVDVDIFA